MSNKRGITKPGAKRSWSARSAKPQKPMKQLKAEFMAGIHKDPAWGQFTGKQSRLIRELVKEGKIRIERAFHGMGFGGIPVNRNRLVPLVPAPPPAASGPSPFAKRRADNAARALAAKTTGKGRSRGAT